VAVPFTPLDSYFPHSVGFHSSERMYDGSYDELFFASSYCTSFTDYTSYVSRPYSIFTDKACMSI
jgi:hypothetical protein